MKFWLFRTAACLRQSGACSTLDFPLLFGPIRIVIGVATITADSWSLKFLSRISLITTAHYKANEFGLS